MLYQCFVELYFSTPNTAAPNLYAAGEDTASHTARQEASKQQNSSYSRVQGCNA